MSKKANKKSRTVVSTPSPTFYDFVRAVVSDRSRADQMLKENPGWIRETNPLSETALHYLAVENYVDAVAYLLSRGADVDGAQEGGTPLTDAAKLGYVDMVALLIQNGANLEMRDLGDNTPLINAAQHGYAEICDLLLAAGADIHVRDGSGLFVLEIALPRKRDRIAQILSRYGYPLPAIQG